MAVYCKMCGGIIEYKKGETTGVCSSCGARQAMPLPIDNGNAHLYRPAGDSRTDHDRGRAAAIGGQILKGIGSGLEKAAPLKETAVRQIGKVKNVQYAEGERKYALFAAICFFLAALVSAIGLWRYFMSSYRFPLIFVIHYCGTLILLGVTIFLENKTAVMIAVVGKLQLETDYYYFGLCGGRYGRYAFRFYAVAYVVLLVLLILAWKKKKAVGFLWFLSGVIFGIGIIAEMYIYVSFKDLLEDILGLMPGFCIEAAALFMTGSWLRKETGCGAEKTAAD